MADTEKDLEAEIVTLESDAEQAIIEGEQRLSQLSARLADLKHRVTRYEQNTKQQKERQP